MSSIDPSSARTAEDFVMLLRQARAMSELSFWQLEKAANAAGQSLEPAVLAEALGLATLPDDQLVAALLHACGYPDEQIERWLEVRDRLALALPTAPPTAPPTAVPAASPAAVPVSVFHEPTAQLPETPPSLEPTAPSAVRARHSLRLPGRGTRRAPGSLLRPLLMAAVAVVIGVGGVAVIVSAVDDGDGDDRTGSAIYRGGPRPTGPAEPPPSDLPSDLPSPPASVTPSLSVSPSPSASPTAGPPVGVLRSGTATLQSGQSIDLDGGGSDPDIIVFGEGNSIRADPSSRHFALEPNAAKQSCATAGGYQKTMQGLTPGTGVCVRTDKGSYAHITVTRTAPLGFSYVVWS